MEEKDYMIFELCRIQKEIEKIIIKLDPESVAYMDLVNAVIEIDGARKRIKEG